MGLVEKLVKFGWLDKAGRSLTWRDLQRKPHRTPVTYLPGEKGILIPIYNVFRAVIQKQQGE